ncbi:carbohydrate ABC transporter permease [Alicyclobacillus fastidiosus]|uniref:Sugar ABC transporter permease n=1 Tax=Alicyclobacillus fastidiosus TaxID=392011 RepID=A0ABV5AMT5_9BACL|nr:sugar ABC transporter permease [Alicyclobacillus fastidiosus]WEH11968.1 sugar ABC transporter permease [Alicyclobacillus fastidiosus]
MAAQVEKKRRRNVLLTRQRQAGIGMLLPGLIIICGITIFPIIYSIWMSLNNVSLTQNGYAMSFTGLSNFNAVIHASSFWHSTWFTFYYSVATVAAELIFGLLIALAINNVQKLKNLSIVVMLIPWSLITVISAQMWDYIYDGVYGVLNYIVVSLHLVSHPVTWLGTPVSAVSAMMIADIWKTTPFVVIIILAGLQMIPNEFYEAARMDGANSWQVFWHIIFPQLRGSIALAGLFRILQAFGVFDLPFVLTNGGPGTATQSLAMLGEKVLFQDLHFGTGSAVAVATVLIVLIISLVFLSAFRSLVTEGEAQ